MKEENFDDSVYQAFARGEKQRMGRNHDRNSSRDSRQGCLSDETISHYEDTDSPIIHLEPSPSIVLEPFVVITGWAESRREILNVWTNEESILSKDESEALIPCFRRIFHKYRSYIYGDTIRFSFTRRMPFKEDWRSLPDLSIW